MIEIYSFFSGMGILDLGFENAGFKIEFVDEKNTAFLEAYKYARRAMNLCPRYGYSSKDVSEYLDDKTWNQQFPEYNTRNSDCFVGFIGGPPCPDFSTAGTNHGEYGKNGHLTTVYVNLIIKRKPDFFVFENVKGLYKTKKHREYYEKIKRKLYHAGYSLFDSMENALSYGAPQDRERLILIGFKRQTFGKRIQYEIGRNRIYNIESIFRLPWPDTDSFVEDGELECPKEIIEELTIQHWFQKNDVNNHPNAEEKFTVRNQTKFYSIPEGSSKGKSFKRLHRWRYSPTAAYGNNEVHLHPYFPRRLSVSEALAIQSLPRSFELPHTLSLSAKFKMIGNGVPYLLSLGIANELNDWLAIHLPKQEEQ